MRASHQRGTSYPSGHIVPFRGDAIARAHLTQNDVGSALKPGNRNYSRPLQQLAWILISLLLLLYLATSYVFWAKIESAWPIFR
jgi:hypothetical protein